ncbi:hypothetical protein BpHYR1_040852 [Brachionus plicatilis]|uniref:Uncharacterized protein n=1 Tax=Brachionus plicatilis TaxID=10195 RepID=A0A3M7SLK1_BRAPC|nr:hypothetical protein BpHYR1_040852 [Brachionus plicatilis]
MSAQKIHLDLHKKFFASEYFCNQEKTDVEMEKIVHESKKRKKKCPFGNADDAEKSKEKEGLLINNSMYTHFHADATYKLKTKRGVIIGVHCQTFVMISPHVPASIKKLTFTVQYKTIVDQILMGIIFCLN